MASFLSRKARAGLPSLQPGDRSGKFARFGLMSDGDSWSEPEELENPVHLYAPGELKAIAYQNGKPWAEALQRTTDPATQIKLTADRTKLTGGHDLSFVTVTIVDAKGQQVMSADYLLRFTITGNAAELTAVGNGDATNPRSFQGTEYPAFHGLALAIIRAKDEAKVKCP